MVSFPNIGILGKHLLIPPIVRYCNDILSTLHAAGIELTELSSHLHGQLIAVHPAYDIPFDGFAPETLRENPKAREEWARSILFKAAKASKNLGLNTHATFSGALAWPYLYPWPQRADGLVETAFTELARRWKPSEHKSFFVRFCITSIYASISIRDIFIRTHSTQFYLTKVHKLPNFD